MPDLMVASEISVCPGACLQLALVASSEALVRSIWEVAMVQGGFEALVEQLWKELSTEPDCPTLVEEGDGQWSSCF